MKNQESRIKVVFFGSDQFSALVLEELLKDFQKKTNKRLEVSAVITSGNSSEVSKIANDNQIPLLSPAKLDQDFLDSNFLLLDSYVFVVASYGKIIPQQLLDLPKFGAINIHPSLLPKYRGPSPLSKQILDDVKTTGVTLIKMDEKMDHGPILAQERLSISDRDNYITLGNKLFLAGEKILIKILDDFLAKKVTLINQDDTKATYCQLIKKTDGYFKIDNPPSLEILDKMIRAYYPWPTAWTFWRDKVVKFLPNGFVQMEGKKPVALKDFLNGYPNFPIKKV